MAEHFVERDANRVFGLLVNSQCSSAEVDLGPTQEFIDLRISGIVETNAEGPAVFVLVRGASVVHRWSQLRGLRQVVLHRGVDPVHAQVGRDAVGHLVPLPVSVDGIGQDVDEARCDHQSSSVERPAARERAVGDLGNGVTVDTDEGDGVEAGFGVDDSTTGDYQVISVVVESRWRCRGESVNSRGCW